ncbi:MAG: hypothetical protein C4520_19025 [Candidatus Abyssobacteria bacterium SURF_5]|uniref:GNAT family N-acetyltransferase n=1 Tax=Abyssobacteria bacterium (strain SURF_5) TaxID=2093360 RepID=A0A3A4N8P3_ABYX5|nr:MAG: hypothetical protein C4520_19025 [Candidatus Abyssubacteria bacterium SURF_5]
MALAGFLLRFSRLQWLTRTPGAVALKTKPTPTRSGSSADPPAPGPHQKKQATKEPEKHFICRLGDEGDLEGITELFKSHEYGPKDVEWLRWKYFRNPDGKANIFLAEDQNGKIIALRAHMPRLFTSEKTGVFLARQSVDLFVAKASRGSGVYSAVWRLCRTGNYPIVSFPNKIAKQLTWNMPGDVRIYIPIDEWWYPLAIGGMFRSRVLKPVAPAANAVSRLYSRLWLGRKTHGLHMKPVRSFERSYSLDHSFLQGVRSAEYLNWRFIDNPVRRYSVYEFFNHENTSLGYCVYYIDKTAAQVYDLVISSHTRACLRLLSDHFRERQISHLIFKSIGFRMRKYGFIRIGSPGFMDTLNTPSGTWLVTIGDKD